MVRAKLSDEVRRAAGIFDTIIIDDFLFTDHCDECASCTADKIRRGIDDWEEYRRSLLLDVCRENIIEAAREVNPGVQMIIKYPCWWQDWEKRGYSPEKQAKLFGKCWIGTETRNAHPYPMQSCWIVESTGKLTNGRCAGGWYDALDCTPDRFMLQAYYTILGGARESLIHCYDYLLAANPGRTPYGEQADSSHKCAEAFSRNSRKLARLANLLYGAEIVSYELDGNGISTHIFNKSGKTITVSLDTDSLKLSCHRSK